MKKLLSLIALVVALGCSHSQDSQMLSAREFEAAVSENNVQLVDVRTPGEFQRGHIQGAINIDVKNQRTFRSSFEKLDKSQPVYIYCYRGPRSRHASKLLKGMGFEQVYDLQGGYLSWLRK